MSLTDEARIVIDELNISKVPTVAKDNKMNTISKTMYHDIMMGYTAANRLESTNKISTERFHFKGENCPHRKEMLKKMGAGSNLCPPEVVNEAEEEIRYEIIYRTVMAGHKIKISFYLKEKDLLHYDGIQNRRIEAILIVIHLLLSCSLKNCSTEIDINFVFTDAKKVLPSSDMDILGPLHMNSGFATRCVPRGSIVIYRKEEWFKLLIHEGFHYFGLDSILDNAHLSKKIADLFQVDVSILTPEAYVETWARILNCYITGFYFTKGKSSFTEFKKYSTFFLELERTYSCFQLVKILAFMGLSYKDLISEGKIHEIKRKMYKENTNVFAYIVLGGILMNNYQEFLQWCNTNNSNTLRFTSRYKLDSFYQLIVESSQSRLLLSMIKLMKRRLIQLTSSKKRKFLIPSTRMTITELDFNIANV